MGVIYSHIGEDYYINKKGILGTGASEIVYDGFDMSNPSFKLAIKAISVDGEQVSISEVRKELAILEKYYQHPSKNILKFHGYIEKLDEKNHGQVYVVMDKSEGSLQDLLNQRTHAFLELEALQIALDIAGGLMTLHDELGITHRDLRPENILNHEGTWVISDFGFSTTDRLFHKSFCGTRAYQAPELQSNSASFTNAVDIWAFGVILHQLLHNTLPFSEDNSDPQGRPKTMSVPQDEKCGWQLIVERCLVENAGGRPRIGDVYRQIQKEFERVRVSSHGLSQGGPVTIEGIIRGCFSNNRRKGYPEFLENRAWGSASLLNENESAEYWINLIPAKTREEFNSSKLSLHKPELKSKYQHELQPYLQSIANCKWCGPYKLDGYPQYFFVSINNSGDNEYFVDLFLNFPTNNSEDQYICLGYYKNPTWVGSSKIFEF